MIHKPEYWRKINKKISNKTVRWDELGGFCLDQFIEFNVRAGVSSVSELMALTYLSQFEKLDGKFASNPIFTLDFQVGIIPYSKNLLNIYNDYAKRMNGSPGFLSGLELGISNEEANTVANFNSFLTNGAQLSRLYKANCKNLDRFNDDENHRGLIHAVSDCVRRDRDMLKLLAYARK
ncbi:hypothetical protein HN385_02635 [archaeon]|jgi:hypothetical protein|nr:hypothetical protein [archaeon]MBT3450647.1 hypothetical protein [archaeon]MBT6868773.1 hypothetical protein [archaeon]MBT7193006.1 hypothetical protein [archaeon]MBT7380972.1 hypothetical protein [archaeon]